jgi:DNA-binding transcriptional LysR family regulator
MIPAENVRQMLEQKDRGWLLLRTIWLVKVSGSFCGAAKRLDMSGVTSIRKRIESLQEQLGGAVLFMSDGTGVMFTADGEELLEILYEEFG